MEKFWTKYLENDSLGRTEMLEPIIKKIENTIKFLNENYDESDEESLFLKGMKSQVIMPYFDDLIEYMYTKISPMTEIECYDEGFEDGKKSLKE